MYDTDVSNLSHRELQELVSDHFQNKLNLNFENVLEDFFRLPKDNNIDELNKRKSKLHK